MNLIVDEQSYLVAKWIQGIFIQNGGSTMRNIVKMSDLTNEEVYQLIERALELKNGKQVEPREDLYVANLFFENSTRTKHSF